MSDKIMRPVCTCDKLHDIEACGFDLGRTSSMPLARTAVFHLLGSPEKIPYFVRVAFRVMCFVNASYVGTR